jgi:hypothetical protein
MCVVLSPKDCVVIEPKWVCFRHATFAKIEKVDPLAPEKDTLHRRMRRCFLKSSPEITIPQMLKNREMLNIWLKKSLIELKPHKILACEKWKSRILLLRRDFLLSFDEFYPFDTVCDLLVPVFMLPEQFRGSI